MKQLSWLGAALLAAACASSAAPTPTPATLNALVVLSTPSCHPRPRTPCTIDVVAAVGNPDGRPLQFAWSGCASGTGSQAVCRIEAPGAVTATVDVSDDRGHVVHAVASAQGTNQPPVPVILDILWESAGSFGGFWQLGDPDGNPNDSLCGRDRVISSSGDCLGASYQCAFFLTGGVPEYSATKTASSGTCTLTVTATDEWGAAGTTTKAISYPRR